MAGVQVDELLDRLATQPFRARFHLRGRERARAGELGPEALRRHAGELVAARLAPAAPRNDGRQTPYRGHPVFLAQHATATCCRSCLHRWHGIAAGRALTGAERDYVLDLICRWVDRELTRGG